jgi:sulfite exporter TauE/SafE/copper chaperone CopZ
MNQKTIQIEGMHCKSCEMLIEDEVKNVRGVSKVCVSQANGTAEIHFEGDLDEEAVQTAVQTAGYSISTSNKTSRKELPWISMDFDDLVSVLFSVMVVLFAFLFLKANRFEIGVAHNFSSLPVVFLIGLTAGISTCMALVGGLVLGSSAKFSQKHPNASPVEKFKPHLYFNLGRVLSFFVFGAVAGLLGSFFTISSSFTGFLSLIAGLAMLFMGLQLVNISPRLSGMTLTLPKSISRKLGIQSSADGEYSNKNSFALGAMTFFLPCGFTQAVQLYAISTGNPLTASLTLGIFALGTTPGLLGIGGLTSIIRGAFGQMFFRLVGVVVVFLSFLNISNGYNLTGGSRALSFVLSNVKADGNRVLGAQTGGSKSVQLLKSTYTVSEDMQPSSFTVNAGQPVRLEVLAKEDGVGCMGSLLIPGIMNRAAIFHQGKTEVIEFMPKQKGVYTIACAMGVPRGTIEVI